VGQLTINRVSLTRPSREKKVTQKEATHARKESKEGSKEENEEVLGRQ
jgi:hypothetical protein